MVKNDWPVLDRWWPQRLEWSRPHYAGFLLTVFLLLGALPYVLINRFSAWRGTTVIEVSFPVDWEIPYVPAFVIPYYSFYLYFPIAAWIGAHESVRKQGMLFFQRMLALTWLAFVAFLVFPSEIRLRSQAVGADGLFGTFMDEMHKADAPYNAWPSLHVMQSVLVVLFVRYALKRRDRWSPLLSVFSWTACASLVASTVLIKQHYVFDGLISIAICAVMWRWWIRPALN